MSNDINLDGFELTSGTYDSIEFPDGEYEILDASEYGSGEKVATEFLTPCLGIIGLSEESDEVYGAHIRSPTGNKVETFLDRYDTDYVIVTGINYDQEQLEGHRLWKDEEDSAFSNRQNQNQLSSVENGSKLPEVLDMSPLEVFESLSPIVSSGDQITSVEDVYLKRGSVENALEERDVEYFAEWADEPINFSVVEASVPDETIAVKHFDL